jgi:hypothetical protein
VIRVFQSLGAVGLAIALAACGLSSSTNAPDGSIDGGDGGTSGSDSLPDGSDGAAHEPTFTKLGETVYGEFMDFEIVDDMMVAVNYYGLTIYDISNPETPVLRGQMATSGEAWRLAVEGQHAFIADGRGGLRIVDISNPESPLQIGSAVIPGEILDVAVRGCYAVVGSLQTHMRVFDLSNLESPVEVGTIPSFASEVEFSGDRYLLAYGPLSPEGLRAVRVFDFSNPTNPIEIGSVELDRYYQGPQTHETPYVPSWGFAVSNQLVFLSDTRFGEMEVVDFSDPNNPFKLGWFNTQAFVIRGLDMKDEHLLAAVDDNVAAFDISNLGEPNEHGRIEPAPDIVGRIQTPKSYYLKEIAVNGSLAVTIGSVFTHDVSPLVLRVLDVGNPASPVELGQVDIGPQYISGIAFNGTYAFFAKSDFPDPYEEPLNGGMLIVDINDPSRPIVAGSFDAAGPVHDIAIDGTHAFLAGEHKFSIVDIADPEEPSFVGILSYPNLKAKKVAVSGNHAFIITGQLSPTLKVIDISDPGTPTKVSELSLPGVSPKGPGIAVHEEYVFIAAGTGGLRVIDCSDPASPVEVGSFTSTGDFAMNVAVCNSYAFLAAGIGVHVLDVSDPGSPVEIIFLDTPGYAKRIASADNIIFIGDTYDFGIYAFDDGL